MDAFSNALEWYTQHKDYIDFLKDIVFAIGVVATFYGYFKFLGFLTRRKMLNKRQEMEYDSKLYSEIQPKLREYVNEFEAKPKKMRDIGIRLLYMKNYPYKLDNDGYQEMLYYYFMSENHKPSGYISGKGLYLMDHVWFLSQSIYLNPKNGKWFVDKKGRSFKRYKELAHKQLVKRIPFANVLGYDFNSDWADKGEPVFYTKYKYDKWKLYADDLEAVSIDDEFSLAHKVSLSKNKRARKLRRFLISRATRIHFYFRTKKLERRLQKNTKNKVK